jgi:CRISPR-associated endonuclease Csn1
MRKILGLDLGSTSIGWAVVTEAESETEQSQILDTGVRLVPLTTDEIDEFSKGKALSTNQKRTLSRGARRNLFRYKLRREALDDLLTRIGFIEKDTPLSEEGKQSTFETLSLRAKGVTEKLSKVEIARVLRALNKKRGYKSSRKAKNEEEGSLIDGMSVALEMKERGLTPGQYVFELIQKGIKSTPDFYNSDLKAEWETIWQQQQTNHPEIFTEDLKEKLLGKSRKEWMAILRKSKNLELAENKGSREEKKYQLYSLRAKALHEAVDPSEAALVLAEINNEINSSSSYLGAISDRSKELHFQNKTIGQYLYEQVQQNPHNRLKNQVFYRKDYEDEFDAIWREQSKHYPELTSDLYQEIKDMIIFYQRRLKSKKSELSICELEGKSKSILLNGKTKETKIGPKVIPKSSPLFQIFKIWQIINNLVVKDFDDDFKAETLSLASKQMIFEELNYKGALSESEILTLLTGKKKNSNLHLNYSLVEGNKTQRALFEIYQDIIEESGHTPFDFKQNTASEILEITGSVFEVLGISTEILTFNAHLSGKEMTRQPHYQLWHLLYSFEGDNSSTGEKKLVAMLTEKFGFPEKYAKKLAKVTFQEDYGNLSAKALGKIVPYLQEGYLYDEAAKMAGYNHSHSLTRSERKERHLKEFLDLLPKNSLRNPVVEKVLNQKINLVNEIIKVYGKPDEVRIELARELKKSAKERESATQGIEKAKKLHQEIEKTLKEDFQLSYVSRNDIIRYKLWVETDKISLYSGKPITASQLFSKEIDIEHIIPKSRLFDDSFANKTLCEREWNRDKGNETAHDYLKRKLSPEEFGQYLERVKDLYSRRKINPPKMKNLLLEGDRIPDGFIERDLRNSQYIAKKAKELLEEVVETVNTTTGAITDKLREDWQLIHVMQELNWDKYQQLGLTYWETNKEGKELRRIKDWTKRNDHRHHAMDAITVAFTQYNHVQYLNFLNARKSTYHRDHAKITAIHNKITYTDKSGNVIFKPPIELDAFRREVKEKLSSVLVSFKSKNKVVTPSRNKIKMKKGHKTVVQLAPRGQLHKETLYGSITHYATKMQKVDKSFDWEVLQKVAKKSHREALIARWEEFGKDPAKAFSGKNAPSKNPIYLNGDQKDVVPQKVKLVELQKIYTIKKQVTPENFKTEKQIDKVIDTKIRDKMKQRWMKAGQDSKIAFGNLEENPIWLDSSQGIAVKSVKISGINSAIALHDKRDKEGNYMVDEKGSKLPVDFVSTGNNHHVAIYEDADGNYQEMVVSFFDAVERVRQGLPIVDKTYRQSEGWKFLFTMKGNEMFVFPNEKTGFVPTADVLMDEKNYAEISPNLFRVQKISTKYYTFRHHLETEIIDLKESMGVLWKRINAPNNLKGVIKVRVNSLGKIVSVGEY